MKKIVLVFLAAVLFQFCSYGQFSFHVFPTGVSGDPYADTLLNTRSILLAGRVKQVNAYQTLAEVTKTFASKTINLDSNGRIEKVNFCMAKRKESSFTLCINNTVVYSPSGQIMHIKTADNKGNFYAPIVFNYKNEHENEIKQDSFISHQMYNERGHLIALSRLNKGLEIENTRFYYNKDGLLDSTYNNHWGTFIFKRRMKGKHKWIEMENYDFSYRWVYNAAGQCISHTIVSKDRPNIVRGNNFKGDLKSEVNYFYNADGTLLKVITKRSDMPTFTMHYSYVKH